MAILNIKRFALRFWWIKCYTDDKYQPFYLTIIWYVIDYRLLSIF